MKKRTIRRSNIVFQLCLFSLLQSVFLSSADASTKAEQAKVASILFNGKTTNYSYNTWGACPDNWCTTKKPGYIGGHSGIDIQTTPKSKQDVFYSVSNGIVIASGSGTYKTLAVYDESRNITVFYLHASAVSVALYKKVSVGTPLGKQGDSGAAAGAIHVHLEAQSGKQTSATSKGKPQTIDPVATALFYINSKTAKPAAPSGLSASVSGTSITLKWKDTSSNESGFNVYRSTGSSWTNLPQKPAGSTSHTDSGLSSSKTYSYKVCAYNATGESCSSSVSAKTGSSSSSSSGSSWDGKNPSGTTCEKDATTVATRSNSYGKVELRWSNSCKTNWTRIISNSSSYSTYGKIRRTSDQKTYETSGTGSRFTNMVYAPNVQACASGTIKGYKLSEVCR
jgi:murein DD-endopeptidase MepM/ murein hydrolase activator NlpD